MAIDARILLEGRPANIDVGRVFNNALVNVQGFDNLQQQREQAPAQNQLLAAQAQQAEQNVEQSAIDNRRSSVVLGAQELKPFLDSGDIQGGLTFLQNRRADLVAQGLDTTETDEAIQGLQQDPQGLKAQVQGIIDAGISQGIIKGPDLGPAGTREFESQIKGLSDEDIALARRIDLGLSPRATGSAAQTIAQTGTAGQVAASEAEIAGAVEQAREGAKLGQQLKFKPRIARDVKLATAEAAARGETLTALQRSEAALPGLLEATDQLKELSVLATSTFGGKIFDEAVKQTGFGATKGSTARAKFIAIVNNQVLPLLRETFGAAFTAQEGESLKRTMGDPDATPAEKMVQLDAFIAQKQRDIETKQRELGISDGQSTLPGSFTSNSGIVFEVQ